MRFSTLLAAVLAADAVVASSWFGKAVYNKWHETELERWLSDHNIPYPTPADRKDLENLVKDNWNEYVVRPYNNWDVQQLQKYLKSKGEPIQKGAEKNKDSLQTQVQSTWTDTEARASEAYSAVENWIFDSWSDSQLKAFCDKHDIPVPQPKSRDSLLRTARRDYQAIATKLGETAAYPGDWLYSTWTNSELKAWCDERGISVPQPTERDRLIAAVRRNSRSAANALAAFSASMAATASGAAQSVSDAVFDTYSDSQLKKWADEHGVPVPQGSKRNELLALVRRRAAQMNAQASSLSASAASAYGAATSSAGNEYARASEDAASKYQNVKSVVDDYINWVWRQVGLAKDDAQAAAESASAAAKKKEQRVGDRAGESAQEARQRVEEASKKAADYAKKEL